MNPVYVGLIGSRFQAECHASSIAMIPSEMVVGAVASLTGMNVASFAGRHRIANLTGADASMLLSPRANPTLTPPFSRSYNRGQTFAKRTDSMAGQAPSRRQLLQALACASLASGAPGFVRWTFAFAEPSPEQGHAHHQPSAGAPAHKPQHYTPQFFTPPEYKAVVVLAELILPRTPASHPAGKPNTAVTPAEAGATDAGVAEFIDFMVGHDPALQTVFRQGLAWIDTASTPRTLVALAPAEQNAVLERLAYKRNFRPDDKPGQEFFSVMRRYAVMGFYTTRLGLEALDYPGLRFYAESPSVPPSELQHGALAQIGVHAGAKPTTSS